MLIITRAEAFVLPFEERVVRATSRVTIKTTAAAAALDFSTAHARVVSRMMPGTRGRVDIVAFAPTRVSAKSLLPMPVSRGRLHIEPVRKEHDHLSLLLMAFDMLEAT